MSLAEVYEQEYMKKQTVINYFSIEFLTIFFIY